MTTLSLDLPLALISPVTQSTVRAVTSLVQLASPRRKPSYSSVNLPERCAARHLSQRLSALANEFAFDSDFACMIRDLIESALRTPSPPRPALSASMVGNLEAFVNAQNDLDAFDSEKSEVFPSPRQTRRSKVFISSDTRLDLQSYVIGADEQSEDPFSDDYEFVENDEYLSSDFDDEDYENSFFTSPISSSTSSSSSSSDDFEWDFPTTPAHFIPCQSPAFVTPPPSVSYATTGFAALPVIEEEDEEEADKGKDYKPFEIIAPKPTTPSIPSLDWDEGYLDEDLSFLDEDLIFGENVDILEVEKVCTPIFKEEQEEEYGPGFVDLSSLRKPLPKKRFRCRGPRDGSLRRLANYHSWMEKDVPLLPTYLQNQLPWWYQQRPSFYSYTFSPYNVRMCHYYRS